MRKEKRLPNSPEREKKRSGHGILRVIVLIVVALTLIALVFVWQAIRRRHVVTQDPATELGDYETLVPLAPIGDSVQDTQYSAVIYYPDIEYRNLVPTARTLTVGSNTTLAEEIVRSTLSHPEEKWLASLAADDIQMQSLELSCSCATVSLSIDARRLDDERMQLVRTAIADSLLALDEIDCVNVLVADRDEGVKQYPTGSFLNITTNFSAAWQERTAELEALDDTQSGFLLKRSAILYFGAQSGDYLLPENASLRIETPDCLSAVLARLMKGPVDTDTYRALLPSGMEYLAKAPEMLSMADGRRIACVCFAAGLEDWFRENNVDKSLALGSLVRTICAFVPETDGVMCRIGDSLVTGIDAENGRSAYTFEDGIMRASDFESRVGAIAHVCYPTGNGAVLRMVDCVMSRYRVENPRALLVRLMTAPDGCVSPMPEGVTDADIIGVSVENGQVLINLSSEFYTACRDMSGDGARAFVYAIVNTMCRLRGIRSVRFYFDSDRVDTIAGTIFVRGPILSNPGLIESVR